MDKTTFINTFVKNYLPEGLDEWLECTDIQQDTDDDGKKHARIFLQEKDNRKNLTGFGTLQENGYTLTRTVKDLPPLKDEIILLVKRRKWLDGTGQTCVLDIASLYPGIDILSDDLARVLKGNR